MKKIALLIAAALAFTAVSCQKEPVNNEPVNTGRVFTFVADSPEITKAFFDTTARVFQWNKPGDNNSGDWVKFHLDGQDWGDNLPEAPDGDGWKHVRNTAENDGDRAVFSLSGVNGTNITAVYPTDGITYQGFGSVSGSINTSQTAGADHVAPNFPLLAVANNISADNVNNLVFRNIATLIKFTLDPSLSESGTKYVYGVTIATNSGQGNNVPFVGNYTATVNSTTGELTVDTSSAAGTFIDFTSTSGSFELGKAYYMQVLPVTLSEGFKIYIKRRNTPGNSDAGQVELVATRPFVLKANKINNLGVLKASTASSEFRFTNPADAERDITSAAPEQYAYNILNPGGKAFTAKLEYYVDGVLTQQTSYGGPDGDPAVQIQNGANLYFQGESCSTNQIFLRGIPANNSLKEHKYIVRIMPEGGVEGDELVAVVNQAIGSGYSFTISKAESVGVNYLNNDKSDESAKALYAAVSTDASVSWTVTVSYTQGGSGDPVIVKKDGSSDDSFGGSGDSGDLIYQIPANNNSTNRVWTITAVTTSDDVPEANRTQTKTFTQVGIRTITVGVIDYLPHADADVYKVHYWGGCKGTQDVTLTSLNSTETKEVGYWAQGTKHTFHMYSATVSNDITNFAVWHTNDNRWFNSDGDADASTKTKAYIFEYGGVNHALYE